MQLKQNQYILRGRIIVMHLSRWVLDFPSIFLDKSSIFLKSMFRTFDGQACLAKLIDMTGSFVHSSIHHNFDSLLIIENFDSIHDVIHFPRSGAVMPEEP